MVDYSAEAITRRLDEMAKASAADPRPTHAIDMSPEGVTARLETLGALSALCWSLAKASV